MKTLAGRTDIDVEGKMKHIVRIMRVFTDNTPLILIMENSKRKYWKRGTEK